MKLLLDVGNTRLKWQIVNSGSQVGAAKSGAIKLIDASDEQTLSDALSQLRKSNGSIDWAKLQRLAVTSVRSQAFNEQLSGLLYKLFRVTPILARTLKQQAGVTCAYADESRMGVDRWLAILAAYSRYRDPDADICVVDSGTATTVDFVSSDGTHQGGFIIPGAQLMKNSLLANTDRVRFSSDETSNGSLSWGKSTADAVCNGVLFTQIAIIEKVMAEISVSLSGRLVVTGGYVSAFPPDTLSQCLHVPDLVMQGLDIYSDHPPI